MLLVRAEGCEVLPGGPCRSGARKAGVGAALLWSQKMHPPESSLGSRGTDCLAFSPAVTDLC